VKTTLSHPGATILVTSGWVPAEVFLNIAAGSQSKSYDDETLGAPHILEETNSHWDGPSQTPTKHEGRLHIARRLRRCHGSLLVLVLCFAEGDIVRSGSAERVHYLLDCCDVVVVVESYEENRLVDSLCVPFTINDGRSFALPNTTTNRFTSMAEPYLLQGNSFPGVVDIPRQSVTQQEDE
jgi:hypothetical protein